MQVIECAAVLRVPIADTKATFAIRLEPKADGRSVSFKFGFLKKDGRSLLRCQSTGTRRSPLDFIALLRAAVDGLKAQAKELPAGAVQVHDVLVSNAPTPARGNGFIRPQEG